MANQGATTVGTIKGDLKLDIDDWKAKIAVVKADAEELGARHPNIKVEADTGAAQASLAAVDAAAEAVGATSERTGRRVKASANDVAAAEAKMAAAGQAAMLAAKAEELAAQRLEAAQSKRGRTDISVAAAELALERATARATAAQEKNLAAANTLTATRHAAAVAAAAEASAQDGETDAINRSNTAQNGHIQRWQMILGLIGAAIPLIAPLAGYALGVAGAFAGMGAAGVLALLGIKAAMASGSVEGQSFRAGLNQLQGDMNGLASTAATAMLRQFQAAVAQINAAMPSLNQEVEGFSVQLGMIGNTVLKGVITAFQVLNPLFVQSGVYVQDLADGFQQWTADGGLQRFADYAAQSLPRVAAALGSLASAALHVVEATAPIGTVVLAALQALGNVINAIPTGVLGDVIVVAGGVFLAFKAWSAISPIVDAVATSIKTGLVAELLATLGPLGAVTAATGAVVAAFGAWQIAAAAQTAFQQAGALATQDYTSAVIADTGAIGENTRAHLAKAIADSGAVQAANQIGISTATYTQAILGNKDALDQVREATSKNADGAAVQDAIMRKTKMNLTDVSLAQLTVADGLKTNKKAIADAKAYWDVYNASLNANKTTQSQVASAAVTLTAALNTQTNSVTFLDNAFKLLNGENLDAAAAATAQAAAFNNVTDAFKQNGTAINGSTKAAVGNQQAIQQAATAAQQNSHAVEVQTGSTDKGTQAFMASKTALEKQLKAQGDLTPAVQAYVNTLFKVPDELATQLKVDNAQAAIKAALAVKAAVDAIPTNVTIDIHGGTHINTGGATKIKQAFAGGGTVTGPGSRTQDRVMASLSATEEVTSNDRGQADKWRPVLKMINTDQPAGSIAGRVNQMAGTQAVSVASAPSDRPIYLDGALFGVLRELANGEARIVLNQGLSSVAFQLSGGLV